MVDFSPSEGRGANGANLVALLREDVVSCAIVPGQRLKFGELRTQYDTGIGSLREALQVLTSEGLVISQKNLGFAVAPVSLSDLQDVTEMRVDIERKALIRSIQRGTPAWEASILSAHHLLSRFETSVSREPLLERQEWESLHEHLHNTFAAACKSPRLLSFRHTLWRHSERYRAISVKQSAPPGRNPVHDELVKLVIGRDWKRAADAIELHIRHAADNVRKWLAAQDALTLSPPVHRLALHRMKANGATSRRAASRPARLTR